MKRFVVAAFFVMLAAAGGTALVQHNSTANSTVSVSAETTCRNVAQRAFTGLANGRFTHARAVAMVDTACKDLPASTRDAIVAHEKAAVEAHSQPAPS